MRLIIRKTKTHRPSSKVKEPSKRMDTWEIVSTRCSRGGSVVGVLWNEDVVQYIRHLMKKDDNEQASNS